MTRCKVIFVGLGLLLGVGLLVLLAWLPGQNSNDTDKLQGRWRLIAQAADGEPETTANLKDLFLVVEDASAKIIHDDEPIDTTYTLDMTKRPKTIDMVIVAGPDQRKTIQAIYSFDGDNLKLCWNEDTFERPSGFQSQQHLVVSTFTRQGL
jgi:uncharacterized protein (TIGR03067 family)